jgi:hypothetical protein
VIDDGGGAEGGKEEEAHNNNKNSRSLELPAMTQVFDSWTVESQSSHQSKYGKRTLAHVTNVLTAHRKP